MAECMACSRVYTELHPLRHLKCNIHHFCEDCFCDALKLAIDREGEHSIPCGEKTCPRLEFEDVKAILSRCTTIETSRRGDLLQSYAHRLTKYNTDLSSTCVVCHEGSTDLSCMPCGQHGYCDDCFCTATERAIAHEANYPIPCGSAKCPHPSFQEVEKVLTSFLSVEATQRDDVLGRYATRLAEYNTPILNRMYCSNQACMVVHGSTRFLDMNTCSVGNGSRVRCPDCTTTTCVNCKGPWNGPNHICILAARDAEDYIASLPEEEKWQWLKCGRCNTWVGKEDVQSCNHMSCRYVRLCSLSCRPWFKLTTFHSCKYEFCLICGREWEGYVLCSHGCPKHGPAVYDDEDYNQAGYHRVTGRNRAGAFRALDALESDELPYEGEDDNDDGVERGHIYAVPFLGRIVGLRTTINRPVDLPSLGVMLTNWKFWALLALQLLLLYGPIVLLHNKLEALGYAYNGWGMDRDGYDIHGYSMC
jgi:hypothetical protein